LALLNSKRLVVPEADPTMAENFPEKRLASQWLHFLTDSVFLKQLQKFRKEKPARAPK